MIYAYAIEPEVVLTWVETSNFRFVRDKFGLGTPRVVLGLPKAVDWRRAVKALGDEQALTVGEQSRLTELIVQLGTNCAGRDARYFDDRLGWVENAVAEWNRRAYQAIVVTEKSSLCEAVMSAEALGDKDPRWDLAMGKVVPRSAKDMVAVLEPLLAQSGEIHLVDPYFYPGSKRHRILLEERARVATHDGRRSLRITVHVKAAEHRSIAEFDRDSQVMSHRLMQGAVIHFRRWRSNDGGERVQNRYILTDIGGVTCGDGIEDGKPGETDDFNILSPDQYRHRWQLYAQERGLEPIDTPRPVQGSKRVRT